MPTLIRPPHQSNRPATFRQIAQMAGVSQMTVSRALGNRPRVAPATRKKILTIAHRLGYRPDPEISKLMHYLRRGVRPQFQSMIAGVTNWPIDTMPPYFQALLQGAKEMAAARGYGFCVIPFDEEVSPSTRLQRLLRSRGVQGVMLLPQQASLDLSRLLDWREFSVVAASISVIGPEVHRVAPHHFANTMNLCRQLAASGYRRIGLVIERGHDARVNHGFSAATVSHAAHEAREAVAPLVYVGELKEKIEPWFRCERPDVVVGTSEVQARECARLLRGKIPGSIAFASTSVEVASTETPTIAGIDELPGEIGAIALELLAGMIERRKKGLPVAPTSTLVSGQWRRGRSLPAFRLRATALALTSDP